MVKIYTTTAEVIEKAEMIVNKSLRDVLKVEELAFIENRIGEYGMRRKGFLGDLVEKYFFEIEPGNASEPDFKPLALELKTTPLKENRDKKIRFSSKERLVFSMINYNEIVSEKWETSSFLKKNSNLLLMFYLWMEKQNILDYKFEYVHLLNLLDGGISEEDIFQIKKDWEYIVRKISRGEAHLLSEGDTYYLGACTKSKDSSILRDQPATRIPAKPRAFSFKQQYLNYLIQKKLLGNDVNTESIFKKIRRVETIEDAVADIFSPYLGKTTKEIMSSLGLEIKGSPKRLNRMLIDRILGFKADKMVELEKANVTLRVINLEHTGTLRESISFRHFIYKDLVDEIWQDIDGVPIADFHVQLETKKFLFVVFQKIKDSNISVFKKTMFWNFPMEDIDAARDVWQETINLIKEGNIVKEIKTQKDGKRMRYTYFPGTTFNGIAHVRPHGSTSEDVIELPVADKLTGEKKYTKHCFWLNAEYIQKALEK